MFVFDRVVLPQSNFRVYVSARDSLSLRLCGNPLYVYRTKPTERA